MLDPNAFSGAAVTNAMAAGDVAELQKALTAGYGTDVSQLSGGGALRIQSLDKTMQATIAENSDFRMWNKLPKPKAGGTVDEWTEQNGVGGFLGGSTNSETGIINGATGNYNRRVGMVKYLMTRREVSFVTTLQNSITAPEAAEYSNGAIQLCSDAEYLMFEGDSACVGTEFDGIFAQLRNAVAAGTIDGNHVIDAGGQPLSSVSSLNQAAASIRGFGNFGRPTDLFMSMQTQADFDTALDPAFRVPLPNMPNGGIMIGAPVIGIRTSAGNIATNDDVFIRDGDQMTPFEVRYPAYAVQNIGIMPTVTVAPPANDPASKFAANQAGNYRYLVTGKNANGESTGVVSAQVAIGAGQAAVLTITRSAGQQETAYVIYRNRLNGGATVNGGVDGMSDFREMCRVPATGANTTYVDRNRDIPGTTKAFVLNMDKSATAITWRQLLPMMKFALYPTQTAVIPWAQLLFGYLRISKLRHHVVIKNILTNGAIFRPFN